VERSKPIKVSLHEHTCTTPSAPAQQPLT
jgi:hypothetical protein